MGKVGLEKSFEEKLIGSNDIERYEVNAYGRRISQLEFQKGEKGKTLRLTIDTKVQQLANEFKQWAADNGFEPEYFNLVDGYVR